MEQNQTILPQLNGLPHFKVILTWIIQNGLIKLFNNLLPEWVGYFTASKCLSRNEMTDFFFSKKGSDRWETLSVYDHMVVIFVPVSLAWLLLNLCRCVCTSSSLSSALSVLTSWEIWRSGYSQQSSIEWSSWFFCYLNSVLLPTYVAIGNNET